MVGGFFKAVIGLLTRPSIGIIEALSKQLQGVGLAFLGKRGIQVWDKCGTKDHSCVDPSIDHEVLKIVDMEGSVVFPMLLMLVYLLILASG